MILSQLFLQEKGAVKVVSTVQLNTIGLKVEKVEKQEALESDQYRRMLFKGFHREMQAEATCTALIVIDTKNLRGLEFKVHLQGAIALTILKRNKRHKLLLRNRK